MKKRPSETAIAAAHDGTSLWESAGLLLKARSLLPEDEKKKKKTDKKKLPRLVVESVDEKRTDISTYLSDLLLQRRPEQEEVAVESGTHYDKKEYTGDDEALERLGIETSEDAIHFFSSSRSREDVSIKFVHLVDAAVCPAHLLGFKAAEATRTHFAQPFRPYDLTVLPSATNTTMLMKAGVEFFTMSSEGLVRMGVKGQPSEFIPLTRWIRETTCFNTISSIPFFKDYLRRKCFLAWRANVSFLLFRRQRKLVADKLYIGMSTFSPALLALNKRLYEMRESIKLLDYGTGPVAVSHRHTPGKATKKDKRQDKRRGRHGNNHNHKSSAGSRGPSSPSSDAGGHESHLIHGISHHQQYKDANVWFENRQLNAREAAFKLLNDGLDEAAKKIHSVLKSVIASAMPSTNRGADGEKKDVHLDDPVSQVLREYEDGASKPRSMSGLRELEKGKQLALRKASHEMSLLGDFVRLADYVAVDSLLQITLSSWSKLLTEMIKPRRQSGYLETQVLFSESQSTFAPDCHFLQTLIGNLADETVGAISKVMRILYVKPRDLNEERKEERRRRRRRKRQQGSSGEDKEEAKEVDGAKKAEEEEEEMATPEQIAELGLVVKDLATNRTHPNVADMISENLEFQAICSSLNAKVEADFAKAQEYVDSPAFEKIWPIYKFCKSWEFDAFKSKNQTVASLRHELERMSNWQKELDKMRTRQTVGMLDVESRKLRDLLAPTLKNSMEKLKDHTRHLTRAKCKDQHGKFTAVLAKIDVSKFVEEEADSLENFAAFHGRVEAQRAQSRSLMKHAQLAEQMYHLLKEFEIKFAESDSVQMDEIRAMQAKYHDQLDNCESFCAGRMPAAISQLDEKVNAFEMSLNSLAADLNNTFADVGQGFVNPSQQVQKLDQKQTHLDALYKTDAELNKIRRLLRRERGEESDVDGLAQIAEQFDTFKSLWILVERWVNDLKNWLHNDFFGLDVEKMAHSVQAYHEDVVKLKQSTFGSPVVNELFGQVNSFREEKFPLVRCLRSKKLSPQSWKLVLEKLGIQEENVTLDHLIRAGCGQHIDFMTQIADDSALPGEEAREVLEDILSKIG